MAAPGNDVEMWEEQVNNSLFRVFLRRTRGSRTSVSSTRRQHLAAASLPDGVEFGGTRGNLVGRRFRELLQGHVIIEAHQGFDSRRLHFDRLLPRGVNSQERVLAAAPLRRFVVTHSIFHCVEFGMGGRLLMDSIAGGERCSTFFVGLMTRTSRCKRSKALPSAHLASLAEVSSQSSASEAELR